MLNLMQGQLEILSYQQNETHSIQLQQFTIHCQQNVYPPIDGNGNRLDKFTDDFETCAKAFNPSPDMMLRVLPFLMKPNTHKLFREIPYPLCELISKQQVLCVTN